MHQQKVIQDYVPSLQRLLCVLNYLINSTKVNGAAHMFKVKHVYISACGIMGTETKLVISFRVFSFSNSLLALTLRKFYISHWLIGEVSHFALVLIFIRVQWIYSTSQK